ncbi:THAP domain-containing protein 9, partial [Stegodyphus mimosarum]
MNEPSSKKFPSTLRSFALTLHFYPSKAYDFVRETFAKSLPHPQTLRKWYANVGGGPGFTQEVHDTLKSKVSKSKSVIVCSLMVDEMCIRRKVEWTGKKLCGLIDYGTDTNDDSL